MIRTLLLLAGILGALAAADTPDKDRIFQRSGPLIEAAEVMSETVDGVTYKVTPTTQPSVKRSTQVLRVEYAGMQSGTFRAGLDALAVGLYDEAAGSFHQAAQGEREWEKVYGGLREGEALELAKRHADAAKALQTVVSAFPKHRLILDTSYRLGMNLAWAKDPAAGRIADGLTELSKGVAGQAAESRANAIRAVMAAVAGNAAKLDEFAKKAPLRPAEEFDTWFHFSLWLANAYRQAGKAKEAVRTIDGMLPVLDGEPARKAQALGIKGLALADGDPQAAVIELVKLDLLPFGSEELRCEARFTAGRLLAGEAKALAANPETARDERKAGFLVELNRTVRLLLQAASDSPTGHPAKDQARTLLMTLPPEP